MKKLIALMALASMFAVGCAHNKENRGGTSDSNYSTSDTSSGEKGKMQDNANTPSSTTGTSSSTSTNSSTSGQQP